VWGKGQLRVGTAIHHVRQRLPMPLRGVDSDNGSEFINHDLGASARASPSPAAAPIRRTTAPMSSRRTARSSAPLIGYDRYARAAYAQLARVYALARLHINFFQPVQKLVTKERRGPRVHRVYDRAQTPYQRLRATGGLPGARRQELEVLFSASTSCTCAARSRRPWSGSGPWRSRPGRPQRHPRKTPRRESTTTHSASGRRTRCRRRLPGTRTHCRRNRVRELRCRLGRKRHDPAGRASGLSSDCTLHSAYCTVWCAVPGKSAIL
jgi:hypothetical protein